MSVRFIPSARGDDQRATIRVEERGSGVLLRMDRHDLLAADAIRNGARGRRRAKWIPDMRAWSVPEDIWPGVRGALRGIGCRLIERPTR